jgi:hypothetical protein
METLAADLALLSLQESGGMKARAEVEIKWWKEDL